MAKGRRFGFRDGRRFRDVRIRGDVVVPRDENALCVNVLDVNVLDDCENGCGVE